MPTLGIRLAAFALLLPVLAGCGANSRSLFGGTMTVSLWSDPGINQDSPVPVELVVVYDRALLQLLLTYSADTWFAKREQIRRDYPDGGGFVSRSWELVPGQDWGPDKLDFGVGARGALVFADYFAPGDHRQRVDPHQNVVIRLEEDDFTVQQTQ